MMPPAQTSGDGRLDQNPAGTALPTVNWSLVAAATPRVAWPASIDADPWATTSLKYGPSVASAGTTSCTGIVADCFGSRCTSVWPGLNQDFGTSRPVPLDRRCTSSRVSRTRSATPTTAWEVESRMVFVPESKTSGGLR